MQLRTVKGIKGFFVSSGEGWGVEPTFRIALDRQIKESSEAKSQALTQHMPENICRKLAFQQKNSKAYPFLIPSF